MTTQWNIHSAVTEMDWVIERAREVQKTSISALLTMPKPLTGWITINCGKFWKKSEYQTTRPASWEICIQVRKQQLELWWNIFMRRYEKNQRLLKLLSKYLDGRRHTNPLRERAGNRTAPWPIPQCLGEFWVLPVDHLHKLWRMTVCKCPGS